MSLFSISVVILLASLKKSDSIPGGFRQASYPIRIQFMSLNNDRVLREWSLLAPGYLVKNIMDLLNCFPINMSTSKKQISCGESDEEQGNAEQKKSWLQILRRWRLRPRVEMGPGTFKSEIVNYPPETLANELKKLLALKKRQEERNKKLNEDE